MDSSLSDKFINCGGEIEATHGQLAGSEPYNHTASTNCGTARRAQDIMGGGIHEPGTILLSRGTAGHHCQIHPRLRPGADCGTIATESGTLLLQPPELAASARIGSRLDEDLVVAGSIRDPFLRTLPRGLPPDPGIQDDRYPLG